MQGLADVGGGGVDFLASVSPASWASLDGIARILGCMARSAPSCVKEEFVAPRSRGGGTFGSVGGSGGSCIRDILEALAMPLFACPGGEPTALVALELLKCVKDLSMDPVTLNGIEFAGGIPTLVALLRAPQTNHPPTVAFAAASSSPSSSLLLSRRSSSSSISRSSSSSSSSVYRAV